MNIDIKYLEQIKDELEALGENDVAFIEEDNVTKYVLMPVELYDSIENLAMMINDAQNASVSISSDQEIDLSYDEYEQVKKMIMDAVEKVFMPKPEKLN